ncbi:DUF3231 family protein [Salicibibacter halophilus]|uniref:DUF3231 family protein n=1 Tax=Salicibibacter halophilus TaxID=2502791 RepID=UPI00135CE06D|nr:DUF3231 family protein [Salicibibacter halophilus]
MENHQPLTSSEIGSLWTTYMSNSMLECVFAYALQIVGDDEKIHTLVQEAYDESAQNLTTIRSIFEAESLPVPIGFSTEHDVNAKAKPLFEATFFLDYLHKLGQLGSSIYSSFYAFAVRKDIRDFFANNLTYMAQVYDKTTELMLEKGLLIRPPMISIPNHVEYADKQTYTKGYSLFHDKRTLNVVEISHLYANIETNILGMMLCTGFGQTARSQKIRDYMLRGKDIAQKHTRKFTDKLLESDIQAPMTWDASPLGSSEPPFSDKLMMYHVTSLIQFSIGRYGLASGASFRNDLPLLYGRLMTDIANYANDGADILMKNKWLEEPPRAEDRDRVIQQKNDL